MGLTYDQLFPGRFIKAGEFAGKPVTLTIAAVALDELEKDDGHTESKAIVSFVETKRQWVLVKTNAQCLVALWGPDTDAWLGHRVTLYPERDTSGLSDSGLCIRVKGSPDISKPVTAEIRLPRRRPQKRTLVPTGITPPPEGGGVPVDSASGEVLEGYDVEDSTIGATLAAGAHGGSQAPAPESDDDAAEDDVDAFAMDAGAYAAQREQAAAERQLAGKETGATPDQLNQLSWLWRRLVEAGAGEHELREIVAMLTGGKVKSSELSTSEASDVIRSLTTELRTMQAVKESAA